jgi:subtilisin family serine protease
MFRLDRLTRAVAGAACAGLLATGTAHAAWLWDQNQDKIDDRIVAVETQGLAAAHVGNVLTGKLRFAVMNTTAPFRYGVYVGYDHRPTDADAAALEALGAPVQVRYRYIDYIRTVVTFAQAQQIAALPGVTRVETIPIFYPVNDVAARALRGRDSGNEIFPSVWKHLGVTGKGVVVGILDSGVNDAPEPEFGYPGHESLRGKFLGGGDFWAGQPELNTPLDQSINPRHTADDGTYHGTHVAGTAIGTGGPEGLRAPGVEPGFNAGLAPDARLVDCKVLSDAGSGFGSADALEWCIYNRHNTWGLTGADSIYWGIDVVNMSVGGSDASDGTDANCLAVNAAHRAGIVVLVASGNDGNTSYMPAPGAADLAVTVGAFADDNTVGRGDDYVTDYSNEGPRDSDGDADVRDEMKPNVLGSGTGVNSALGDLASAGDRYHHINGTSMACPSVAGIAALLLSANPTLSADQVREILMNTAEHRRDRGKQPASAADPFGVDPNYHPSWGWGAVDAYAAVKEAQNRMTTQVVQIALDAQRGPDGFVVRWIAQREVGLNRYELDRAPDLNGVPGAWTQVHAVAVANPHHTIAGVPNRHEYAYTDTDPSLDANAHYWYRVRWIDGAGLSHAEPPIRGRIADSPVIARVRFSWTHNYSDGDLYVRFGSGTSTFAPAWFRQAPGAQSADSVVTRPGVNFTGTLQHYFHVDLTAEDLVDGFLPPSAANPWFLSVKEGGYVNTKGTVNDFSVTVFDGPDATTYAAPNPATSTIERQETIFWIPLDPVTTLNHAPVFQPVGDRRVGEGLPLTFQVTATDPDGQPLTYTALSLPGMSSFDAGTRTFSWTPSHGAAGTHTAVFRAADNGFPAAAADTERVTIVVWDRQPGDNTAPTLDPLTDRAGVRGQLVTFRVTASDPENDALTFGATGLPAGASIDPASGIFAWTPGPTQSGIHPVTFTVTDGSLADEETMHLVISNPGAALPPPTNCTPTSDVVTGIVGMGLDPGPKSYTYHSFEVPQYTQLLQGTLSWFLGPTRDLDFHLLDADSNEVTSSASLANPEVVTVTNLPAGTYLWRVTAFVNPDTAHYSIQTDLCVGVAPNVGVDDPAARRELALAPAAPNPMRDLTAIRFTLPAAADARLAIYDVVGRRIRTLHAGALAAGEHVRVWNGRTDRGTPAPAGAYFYRLESNGRSLSRKLVVLH